MIAIPCPASLTTGKVLGERGQPLLISTPETIPPIFGAVLPRPCLPRPLPWEGAREARAELTHPEGWWGSEIG